MLEKRGWGAEKCEGVVGAGRGVCGGGVENRRREKSGERGNGWAVGRKKWKYARKMVETVIRRS
jgi:hypothetical protein